MTRGPVQGWRGPITGWARPLEHERDPAWHGVIAINPRASVETACWGRWPTSERREYVEGRDRDVDHSGRLMKKCGGCELAAQIERTHEGLAELAAAPIVGVDVQRDGAVTTVVARSLSGVVQFDLSDIDPGEEP